MGGKTAIAAGLVMGTVVGAALLGGVVLLAPRLPRARDPGPGHRGAVALGRRRRPRPSPSASPSVGPSPSIAASPVGLVRSGALGVRLGVAVVRPAVGIHRGAVGVRGDSGRPTAGRGAVQTILPGVTVTP